MKNPDTSQADTIQRWPHDQENPYTVLSNEIIRDPSISFECRGLLHYLLSNKFNWQIRVSQIVDHVKSHCGIKKVYKIINEAIQAGYMKRIRNLNTFKTSYTYYISERPVFKESHCEDVGKSDSKKSYVTAQKAVAGNSPNGCTKEVSSSSSLKKEQEEKILIAQPTQASKDKTPGTEKEKNQMPTEKNKMPAGGNNDFSRKLKEEKTKIWKCVDEIPDLKPHQKRPFSKYPEELVKRAIHYAYTLYVFDEPNDPSAQATQEYKMALHFCKNPEQHTDTYEQKTNPKPKKTKEQLIQQQEDIEWAKQKEKREENVKLLAEFFNGDSYAGYRIVVDDAVVAFHKPMKRTETILLYEDNFMQQLSAVKKRLDRS
jgi:hypothetical protein